MAWSYIDIYNCYAGEMKTKKQQLGQWGEQQACLFLTDKGYKIIEQNFSVRTGEIDIIAWHGKYHHGQTLCFVEVKTRQQFDGSAQRATSMHKQARIARAAQTFCLQQGIDTDHTPIQFEQVSVYVHDMNSSSCTILHNVVLDT